MLFRIGSQASQTARSSAIAARAAIGPSTRSRGYRLAVGDGRRLHRARPGLDQGRRADRAARERDRRHHRRRRRVPRSQDHEDHRRRRASPAGSPRTSRWPRSRRCARRSGWRSARTSYDGQFEVPTFDEVIELAQQLGRERGRHDRRLSRDQAPDLLPRHRPAARGPKLLASLEKHGWNRRDSPVFIQSFEAGNLRELRKQTKVRLIQLVSAPRDGSTDAGLKDDRDVRRRHRARTSGSVIPVARRSAPSGRRPISSRARTPPGLLVHIYTHPDRQGVSVAVLPGTPRAEFQQFRGARRRRHVHRLPGRRGARAAMTAATSDQR